MGFLLGILAFLIFLVLWAMTGHGLWIVLLTLSGNRKIRDCPSCRKGIESDALACRHCGWTSRPVDASTGFTICRQAMQSALQRGIIDQAAADRGDEALGRLERAIARERSPDLLPPSEPAAPRSPRLPPIPPSPIVHPSSHVANEPSALEETAALVTPAASVTEAHALDRDYAEESEQVIAPKRAPSRTWSQWLSAFMEENNIRWGELVGGLLIVCCSAALVISFWEHIAQRPWLKFSIFTGINVAVLGLGLYAWHRWKLPTTSKGILVIGLMLLPLNFLAFALFTMGMPWSWPTVLGELGSLGILSGLAWLAARVLTPSCVATTALTPVVFALTNLLIRRTVDAETPPGVLLGWGGWIAGLHALVIGSIWRPLLVRSAGEFIPALEVLALSAFGALLSGGLLAHCSGDVWRAALATSPMLALAAVPSFGMALGIGRRLPNRSPLLLGMILLGAASLALGLSSHGFAWPHPAWLLGCAAASGVLATIAWWESRRPEVAYALYGLLAWSVCLASLGSTGRIAWDNASHAELWKALGSVPTGFALVGLSLVLLLESLFLMRRAWHSAALVAMRSAVGLGILGTVLLTVFGFLRAEYAVSLAIVYAIYALAALAIGILHRRSWAEGACALFTMAACVQWIGAGWVDHHEWVRAFAILVTGCSALLLVLMIQSSTGRVWRNEAFLPTFLNVVLGLATIQVGVWFLVTQGTDWLQGTPNRTAHWLIVVVLWLLAACVGCQRGYWLTAQSLGLIALMVSLWFSHQSEPWSAPGLVDAFHPLMLQWWALGLLFGGLLLVGLAGWFSTIRHRSWSEIFSAIVRLHDETVGQTAIALGAVMVVGILIYGAVPGTLQELLPRDALAETDTVSFLVDGVAQTRTVPSLSRLEAAGSPHAAAGWGMGNERYRLLGLPPGAAPWAMAVIALLGLHVTRRRQTSEESPEISRAMEYRIETWVTVALALWFPLATLWERDVAVASALRWLTASAMLLGSLGLCGWIGRIDRASSSAPRRFLRVDQAYRSLSSNVFCVWVVMGVVVIALALQKAPYTQGVIWVGAITGMMAIFAGLLALILFGSAQRDRSKTHVGAVTAATLMVFPFAAWLVLQVALALLEHPLTGPNPGSIFVRMGLAVSYAVPILMVSLAMVLVSAARPSPHLAFQSSLFLMAGVLVGYMLIVKTAGMRPVSWAGLTAALSITASLFSWIWREYSSRDHRADGLLHGSGRPAREVREDWQRALRHVSAGLLVVGTLLVATLLVANGAALQHVSRASAGLLLANVCLLGAWFWRRVGGPAEFWLLGIGIAVAGLVAPTIASPAFSLVTVASIVAVAGLVSWIAPSRWGWGEKASWGANALFVYLIVLAIRLMDPGGLMVTARTASGFSVLVFVGATLLALARAWRFRDRGSMIWALVASQGAGLAYSLGYAWGGWGEAAMVRCVLLQLALAALLSGWGTLLGYGNRVRAPLHFATLLLTVMSGVWMFQALFSWGASPAGGFPSAEFLFAAASCAFGGLTGYWRRDAVDADSVTYLSGLCGSVWLLQQFHPSPQTLTWSSAVVFAAYCLASSFAWRAGGRFREEVARWVRLPAPPPRSASRLVVGLNVLLAMVVALLALSSQFQCEDLSMRFTAAQSILAVSLAVGFLARYVSLGTTAATEGTPPTSGAWNERMMRMLALGLGVLYAVAVVWHVMPSTSTRFLDRAGVAMLAVTLSGAFYGFGLIKFMGLREEWQRAALRMMPAIVGVGISLGLMCLAIELGIAAPTSDRGLAAYPSLCIALALALCMVLCLAAALLPGRDPLEFSERGREVYVYLAQGLLVALVIHLRLAYPWLFAGIFQQVWPLLALALGFGGLALADWARKRGHHVLVRPLTHSGMFLPLLPILAPWLASSRIDYGVTLIGAAVGYGLFAYQHRSPLFLAASILAANGALWYGLHRADFAFQRHPQLWVIPPALCVFFAAQWFRHRLHARQMAAARYLSIGSIYVASTSEIFLQGISQAPWLPIVLAFLSVAGILYGIAARIRSMLWLGSMFLCVALFSILWYAAVDLEQTWIWYVCGIVLGVVILVMFALFEKRREELKKIVANMQEWEE